MVTPELKCPTTNFTPSDRNLLATETPCFGSDTSSPTTILICSHLLQQLETVCHRYLFIDAGRLIEQGTLAELKARYREAVLLEVDTDLEPAAAEAHGRAFEVAQVDGRRKLTFRLDDRAEVPGFLRRLVASADVYGAHVVEQGLEELYFAIREEKVA